jgi:hypothetical protein
MGPVARGDENVELLAVCETRMIADVPKLPDVEISIGGERQWPAGGRKAGTTVPARAPVTRIETCGTVVPPYSPAFT